MKITLFKILQNKQRNHRPQTNQNDQQQTKEPQHQPDCTQKQHHEVEILSEQPCSHPDNKPTNQNDTPTIIDDTQPNLCSPQHITTTNQKTKTYDAGKIKGPRDYGPKNKRAHRPPIKKKNINIYIFNLNFVFKFKMSNIFYINNFVTGFCSKNHRPHRTIKL